MEVKKDANDSIAFLYDATGSKLELITDSGGAFKKRYYFGALEYNGDKSLSLIHMDEGVLNKTSGGYSYEYFLKDHLGNVRIVFKPGSNPVMQKTDYYPFGMAFSNQETSTDNRYLYNGKEMQDNTLSGGLALNWYDYGARFYDPQ